MPKEVTARFELAQWINCPFCHKEINVIATNAVRGSGETMVVTQKIMSNLEHGKHSGTQDVTVTVPKPFWFGAIGQDSENLHEVFICPWCEKIMIVKDVIWDYSFMHRRKESPLVKWLRHNLMNMTRVRE